MIRPAPVAPAARPLVALVALLTLLAPRAAADEQRGLQLVREAQAAMAAGDHGQAVELLQQARVEWPASSLVANTLADALRELDRYPEALGEYERGLTGELGGHALFNGAVTRHLFAEQLLEQAGVPADAAALPEGPQPEMLAAVDQASGQLERATDDFLAVLGQQPDEAARESIEALSRRSEALAAIAEELRRRQEQQPPQDQQQQEQQGDQEQEQQPQPDSQKQDQQQPDQQQGEQEQQPQDQEQQEQEQDAQESEQESEQEPEPTPSETPQPQGEPRQLSPEEMQQLLDRLDELEQQARELQKEREAARRRPVEKDW